MSRGVPQLRSLLLRLRQATILQSQQQQYQQPQLLPAFALAIDGGGASAGASFPLHPHVQQQQTRAKRTVRVVLKRDDPLTGGRAGDVMRVPAGRQRLDLFPAGAADYATPRALREARALAGGEEAEAAAAAAAKAAEEERAAASDDNNDEEASLAKALEVLESKAVVLRRRGKPAAASSSASSSSAAGAAAAAEDGSAETATPIGRVTRADVARAVERQLGVALDDRLLLMGDEGIRAFGEYRVPLNLVAAHFAAGDGNDEKKTGGRAGDGGDRRRQAHVRVDVVRTWR